MEKYIVDTNVPTKASYPMEEWNEEELELIESCIDFVYNLIRNPQSKLVLDMDREIVGEYENNIKETDIGKMFLRWLYHYMAGMDIMNDMLKLEKTKDGSYKDFPADEALQGLDLADRKFIALSAAHKDKPMLIQAADGKWLEFEEALRKYGIHIEFLNPEYANKKFTKKILNKRK